MPAFQSVIPLRSVCLRVSGAVAPSAPPIRGGLSRRDLLTFCGGATRADRSYRDYRAWAQSQPRQSPLLWITAQLGSIVFELLGVELKTDEYVKIFAKLARTQRYFLGQLFETTDPAAVVFELVPRFEHLFRQDHASFALGNGHVITKLAPGILIGGSALHLENELQVDRDLARPVVFQVGFARSIEPGKTCIDDDVGQIASRPWPEYR